MIKEMLFLKKTENQFFFFKTFYIIFCKYSSPKTRHWTIAESRRIRGSSITYFRGDNSDGVQTRAFIRGRTHFLLMYRRPAAISYARRNDFGESVIGHLWRTAPNRCVRLSRWGAIATFHEFIAIHLRVRIAFSYTAWITDPDLALIRIDGMEESQKNSKTLNY